MIGSSLLLMGFLIRGRWLEKRLYAEVGVEAIDGVVVILIPMQHKDPLTCMLSRSTCVDNRTCVRYAITIVGRNCAYCTEHKH